MATKKKQATASRPDYEIETLAMIRAVKSRLSNLSNDHLAQLYRQWSQEACCNWVSITPKSVKHFIRWATTAPCELEAADGSPSGTVTHCAQYGSVPAFYLFIHSQTGMFDVRGLGVEIPDDWTKLTDAERLQFAARSYRPMQPDEMLLNSIQWSNASRRNHQAGT